MSDPVFDLAITVRDTQAGAPAGTALIRGIAALLIAAQQGGTPTLRDIIQGLSRNEMYLVDAVFHAPVAPKPD